MKKKLYLIPATQEQEMTFGQMMAGSYTPMGKGDDVPSGPDNPIHIN